MRKQISEVFEIDITLIGGYALKHETPWPKRNVSVDSVEASSEFITEIMEDYKRMPTESQGIIEWGFRNINSKDN
jgi:hypothetical protein